MQDGGIGLLQGLHASGNPQGHVGLFAPSSSAGASARAEPHCELDCMSSFVPWAELAPSQARAPTMPVQGSCMTVAFMCPGIRRSAQAINSLLPLCAGGVWSMV